MKKFVVILCALVMLFALTACNFVSVYSIAIEEMPKTVFAKDSTESITVKIRVLESSSDGGEVLTFVASNKGVITNNTYGIEVNGFDLTQAVGYYTATISYEGQSVSFQYQIVNDSATKFSGGNGTQEDPYLISNIQDWNDIDGNYTFNTDNKAVYTYYQLTNDIDFGAEDTLLIRRFYGQIDGDGNTLTVSNVINTIGQFESSRNCIFYHFIGKLVDFNVYFDNVASSLVAYDDFNDKQAVNEDEDPLALPDMNRDDKYVIEFNNVKTYGTILANDYTGVFFNRARSIKDGNNNSINQSKTIKFVNCINNTHIKGGAAEAAGFLRELQKNIYTVEFTNCKNFGTIVASTKAAGFISGISNTPNVTLTNCGNYGKIIAPTVHVCTNKGYVTNTSINLTIENFTKAGRETTITSASDLVAGKVANGKVTLTNNTKSLLDQGYTLVISAVFTEKLTQAAVNAGINGGGGITYVEHVTSKNQTINAGYYTPINVGNITDLIEGINIYTINNVTHYVLNHTNYELSKTTYTISILVYDPAGEFYGFQQIAC
ncbi:MAG: hypothetical protein PHX51_07815 [Clostridia bacterium]|nr:hypothetical protein [Clostridia bacterium]